MQQRKNSTKKYIQWTMVIMMIINISIAFILIGLSISQSYGKIQLLERTFNTSIIILSSFLAGVGFFEIVLYCLLYRGKKKKYKENNNELEQKLIIQEILTPQPPPEIPPPVKNENLVNITKMQTLDPQGYILWLQGQLATMKQKNPQMG